MRLTTQMQVEIGNIRTRVDFMVLHVWDPLTKAQVRDENAIALAAIAELNPYKVRLENILCETDIKEQAHSHQVCR